MRIHITFIAVLVVFGLIGFTNAALAQQRGTVEVTPNTHGAPSFEYEVNGVTLGPRTKDQQSSTHVEVEYMKGNFVPGTTIEFKGTVYINRPQLARNPNIQYNGQILCITKPIGGSREGMLDIARIETIDFGPPEAKRDFNMSGIIPDNCVRVVIGFGASRYGYTGAGFKASLAATDKPTTTATPAPTTPEPPPATAPTPAPSGSVNLTGEWAFNSHGYHGKITITQQDGNQFSGEIIFPGYQSVNIANGRIEGNTVTFTRFFHPYRQDYTGTLITGPDGKATTITGSFTQDGRGSLNWSATKTKSSPKTTQETPPATTTTPKPARFTVEAGKRNVSQGSSVNVPVSLNNVEGLANMNVNIHYDPAVVKPARNASRGNIIPQSLFEANVRDRGVIRLGFAQQTDIRGTGTLAQIPFEAVGRPGTRTALRIEVTTSNTAAGSRVTPAQLIHGEIVIVGADGRLPGDTSGSGSLTALDAMNALKMSVGNLAVDMVADVDRDGRVTARDATLILQQVVGR